MTSISNYYQLSNLASNPSSSSGNTGTSQSPTGIAALEQALALIGDSSGSSGNNDAYLLNLSPQAQALLGGNSFGTGGTSTAAGSATHFTLTQAQAKTIESILEKYKDSPQTQATFDAIQNDLETAGLGADQLSAKDEISSFNPTSVFLDALSGNDNTMQTAQMTQQGEATKATNYMQSIMTEWKSLASAATLTSTTDTTT